MDIYSAILKAADHIETSPGLYDFTCANKTPGPGGNGCLVGWIAYFLGEPAGQKVGTCDQDGICGRIMGVPFKEFFERCGKLCKRHKLYYSNDFGPFTSDPKTAAVVLRIYAAEYHKPALPESVRRIFTHPEQTLPEGVAFSQFQTVQS